MSTSVFNTSLWVAETPEVSIRVIDQRFLPFKKEIFRLDTLDDAFFSIREMVVRGAPLIGVTAAYGMYLALRSYKGDFPFDHLRNAATRLNSARPTAVNLSFATNRMLHVYRPENSIQENIEQFFSEAGKIRSEDIESCRLIGAHGLHIFEEISEMKPGVPVQILTHCNAGWLACIEWGTALAPVYLAHQKGIPLHVWVDETRPRNQGARLTAFELQQAGIPHTIIADNTGGHLMQHGLVDLVIVGSDRTTICGDTANKIGTYLKALAAYDNKIPFYVALPTSTIDLTIEDGLAEIPIEERGSDEVALIEGVCNDSVCKVRLIPEGSAVANYGFDVTPARFISGLITEKGICSADKNSILNLCIEKRTDA